MGHMTKGAHNGSITDKLGEGDLVRNHLILVQYAVNQTASRIPRHVSRDDLVSAGMAGLAQAARSYDATQGVPFDRFASRRIRGAILDELRSRDWASRSVRAKARAVTAITEDLAASLGRTPTRTEIADKAGLDAHGMDELTENVHRSVVLNYESLVSEGNGDEILPADTMTPEMTILERERKAYLIDAVAALPQRLRRVIVGSFFEDMPLLALAEEMGISESRVSQMRTEALELMKDGMNSQLEPDLVIEQRPEGRVAKRKAAYYATVSAGSDFRSRVTASNAGRGRLLALGARQSA